MAFPDGWGRKCALDIQSSQVSANLTDFPVLLTEDCLPSEMFDADGSYPALNGGGDIRFSSDAAGSTQLACEVVSFVTDNNPANGSAEIWVKVPSVSSSTDTVIYVWYNKAGESQPAVSDTYGRNNVWDDYEIVLHLSESGNGTSDEYLDSTGNGNDGTGGNGSSSATPSRVSGSWNYAQDFDGSNDFIQIVGTGGDGVTDWGLADKTVQARLRPDADLSGGNTFNRIWANKGDSGGEPRWRFSVRPNTGTPRMYLESSTNGDTQSVEGDTDTRNAWHSFHYVRDRTADDLICYLDGDEDGSTETDQDKDCSGSDEDITLGKNLIDSGVEFPGLMDEFRFRNSALSSSWVSSEHNMFDAPGSFVVEGTPESPSTTAAPTTLASTTLAPTTAAPTTLAPTTLAPTTLAPTTIAPTTAAPTTAAPTTLAPTTSAPTTTAPTTTAPTTAAPTTSAPTTVAPTTSAPTTSAPTTIVPTTAASTTTTPTTLAPTTLAPTTIAPTTIAPTTLAPTTIAPTTLAPTTTLTTPAPTTTLTAAPTTVPFLTTPAPTTLAPTTYPWTCDWQDLTTYTNRGVTSSKGLVIDEDGRYVRFEDWLTRHYESRLFKDFGTGYFSGDFEFQFDFEINYNSNVGLVGLWAVTNIAGADKSDWTGPYLSVQVSAFKKQLIVTEYGSVTIQYVDNLNIASDTQYFARIIREEGLGANGLLTVQFYSDHARTTLVKQTVVALGSKDDYRYFVTAFSDQQEGGVSTTSRSTGYMGRFCIWNDSIHGAGTTPAPTTAGPTTAPPAYTTIAPSTVVAATIPCCTLSPRTFAPSTEVPSTKDMPTAKTTCGFNGQVIMGNIMGTWYDCYENSVAWSDIGHSDFTLDVSQSIAGYMHMPWEGEVLKVMRLGNYVMVYGDNGVAALRPVEEPLPTFGLVELEGLIGIPARDCVTGNYQKHYFLDRAGALWEINTQLEVKKHDYREYLSAMLDNTIVMSYNEADDEVYLSDGVRGFIKSPAGLSSTYQEVKSLKYYEGTVFATYDEAIDTDVEITTDIFDMGVRGIKTLTTIEIGMSQKESSTDDLSVAVEWRMDRRSAFTRTAWQKTNPQGVLTYFVSGVEFRVLVHCAEGDDFDIDYFNVRYKMSDKRSQRGFTPGQTGKESAGAAL